MNLELPSHARIFILEGIPGAGKDTLQKELKQKLNEAGKLIFDFEEGELLFSWKHGWIKDVMCMRLTFYENFLSYCEEIFAEHPNAVFILNRFHISWWLLFRDFNNQDLVDRYKQVIERLRSLSAFVFVPLLEESVIEARSSHRERIDPIWKLHLDKRLKWSGFSSLTEMWSHDQRKILDLLKDQGLAYQTLDIDAPTK